MGKSTLVILVVLLVCSGVVHAQRDEPPRIPQPISIDDLPRYADILGLSAEQRLSMEAAFDQYVDDVAPLRREMIESAVAHAMVRYRGDAFNGIVVGFAARMQTLDQTFFAAIESMLAEMQRERLQRVRDLRERTMLAHIHTLWFFIGDSLPDLRERLERLNPPQEIILPLTQTLNDYERRLTIGMRDCFHAAMQLCETEHPDDIARSKLIDGVKSLRALNRTAIELWSSSMPETVRQEWLDDALLRAYADLPHDLQFTVLRLKAAMEAELAPAERNRIATLLDDAVRGERECRVAAMDLYDETAIRVAGPQGAIDDVGFSPRMSLIREDCRKRAAALTSSLEEVIGKERLSKLQMPRYRPFRSRSGLASACGIAVLSNVLRDSSVGIPMHRSDPLLPVPLDTRVGAMIADAFAMSDQDLAMVEATITASASALKDSLDPLRESLARAGLNMSRRDPPERDPLEQAQAAEAVRAEMRGKIKTADHRTLESIRASHAIAPDDLRWMCIQRWADRLAITLDIELTNPREPNRSGQVELVPLLLSSRLTSADWTTIEPMLVEYERDLVAARQRLFDDFRKFMIEDQAQRMGWQGKPYDGSAMELLHEQYQALAELNQRMLERLAAALSPETAARLRLAFEQAAYPLAFHDPGSAADMIHRAAVLNDLTPQQRSRISEIRDAHDIAALRTQREMVATCGAYVPDLPYIGMQWTEERSRRTERFSLEFDLLSDTRAQVNRRVVRGLRMTLTPEQFQRLSIAAAE